VTVRDRERLERRVLVLAPTRRDAILTRSVLGDSGVECDCYAEMGELASEVDAGVGVVLLPEEVVISEEYSRFAAWLAGQPPWSDLPVLVLARPGADSAAVAQTMDLLSNVTVLERPIRLAALVSAVRTALRARQRQYQIRDHLAARERAAEQLREADRRKDEFLAVLAHELRNPLAPIRNSLHILRVTSQHDSAADHVSEMMERQVDHMVRLVEDLLEVSRVTRGKIELRMEPVEVAVIVRSAVETSRPLIEAGGHRLTVSLPPETLTLTADPVRVTQVLTNLLNNAARYTDAGGQVWLTTWREAEGVAISVRDNGTGIPPEMLASVFELFTQVDRHASKGGLGIGLTLVKKLVEMHGGSVTAHSEGRGRGSEFVVRLPRVATSATDRPPGRPGSPSLLAPRRVLVVDDNQDAADSLGMLLQLLGADVRIVYDGPAALEAFASHQPDVVFLDIGMPGMDGHEVARRIRQQPASEGVKLIALTGWGQEEDRRRSRGAGFDYHLIKPADLGALRALLGSFEGRRGDLRI
jgi:signal transduction histidine kinase